MDELINKYAQEIVKQFKDHLEALILVGSFSRGEGIEGLSDVEFWAVVNDLSNARKLSLDNNISLGFTTRSHLKRLKPYIYTVEVKKFGRVLYGDSNVLNLIPNYSYEDIDPLDGFMLLNNRIVEQLILLNRIGDNQIIKQYDFDKSYIQLVNSLLVLNRKYKSLYPEKQEAFRKIYKNDYAKLLNKVGEAFTSIKQPSRIPIGQDEALNKWHEARECFRKVWLQEKQMLGALRYWIKVLSLGKLRKFSIYQRASSLYFSDKYQNRKIRETVIKEWENLVK
jgi:hypothetical protein